MNIGNQSKLLWDRMKHHLYPSKTNLQVCELAKAAAVDFFMHTDCNIHRDRMGESKCQHNFIT